MKFTDMILNVKIVLAIPSYNRAKLLEKLLSKVVNQGFHKIYVLDDGSTDNTAEVCKRFKNVKHVTDGNNLGPTGNRNRILKEDTGDVIFFMDDDVLPKTKNLPKITENIFKEHPKAAIISAKILDMNGKPAMFWFEREANPLLWWAEDFFRKVAWPPEAFDKPYVPVAWVLENAFAIKSKVFKELKGFDESFYKFQEGPDLCKRTLLAGYEVAMTNKMTAIHSEPYSIYSRDQFWVYFRSGLIWYKKHAFRFNRN